MGEKARGHSLPAPGDNPAFDAALASPRFGNPLNLAMAGVIAAERGSVAALALRRLDAARHLARHELGRMERIAQGEGIAPLAMEHALGFNGLAGGLTLATLRDDLTAELEAARLPAASAAIADVLMQELPTLGSTTDDASEPRLGTIQPDLIGEGVIVEALLVGPADRSLRAAAIVERAYACTGSRAAEALMRLLQDFGYAFEDPSAGADERSTAQAVLGLLSALTKAIPDSEIWALETLVFSFPNHTTILREVAAAQTQRLADIWRSFVDKMPVERDNSEVLVSARGRAALWLNNLSNRLSGLGQREEALAAVQEAVEMRRLLADANPEAHRPDLAMALNNLALSFGDLAEWDAALAAGQEAADIYRALADASPEVFTASVAGTLTNLAVIMARLGRGRAAVPVAQEGASLFRSLAAEHPETFTPNLAGSLNNLASVLSSQGEREGALVAAQEAADLLRALAAAHPDAFTPDFAGSLNNLANRLSALGRPEAALAAAQEAVDIRFGLAAARPDAFTPDLAMSLSVLGDRLEEVGRLEEAVDADNRSVRALTPYFIATPDTFKESMKAYLRDYVRRAKAADIEVDVELVGPIIEILKRAEGEE